MKITGLVVHKKTSKLYQVISDSVINATNGQEIQTMVLYNDFVTGKKFFVRQYAEFWEKFITLEECFHKNFGVDIGSWKLEDKP